ncbi:hypothetical protein FA15DRAFT_661674 [Coprinopsis marcescibilis]|uniref:Uncharacterized protein n=1 Tax=Coprinopsis marcescibilis TaxID=230819 RepID=A0A5C3KBA7_COPMA|nr:hypothetical protein FA15DRAFT_661674 [Coprinopsis marcescibilis]
MAYELKQTIMVASQLVVNGIRGLLFASHCSKPLLFNVPLQHGYTKANARPFDLESTYYVNNAHLSRAHSALMPKFVVVLCSYPMNRTSIMKAGYAIFWSDPSHTVPSMVTSWWWKCHEKDLPRTWLDIERLSFIQAMVEEYVLLPRKFTHSTKLSRSVILYLAVTPEAWLTRHRFLSWKPEPWPFPEISRPEQTHVYRTIVTSDSKTEEVQTMPFTDDIMLRLLGQQQSLPDLPNIGILSTYHYTCMQYELTRRIRNLLSNHVDSSAFYSFIRLLEHHCALIIGTAACQIVCGSEALPPLTLDILTTSRSLRKDLAVYGFVEWVDEECYSWLTTHVSEVATSSCKGLPYSLKLVHVRSHPLQVIVHSANTLQMNYVSATRIYSLFPADTMANRGIDTAGDK